MELTVGGQIYIKWTKCYLRYSKEDEYRGCPRSWSAWPNHNIGDFIQIQSIMRKELFCSQDAAEGNMVSCDIQIHRSAVHFGSTWFVKTIWGKKKKTCYRAQWDGPIYRAKFLFKRLRMREKLLGQYIRWEDFAL